MGIQFETDYNMETLTAMAKGLRKTVRRKRSRRVHIFAAVVLVLGILTILAAVAGGEPLGASGVVTLLALLVVLALAATLLVAVHRRQVDANEKPCRDN